MFEYEYPRPAASVDVVVSRMIDGEEHILLIRDPRSRVITTAFEATIDPVQTPIAADDAADWQWKSLESQIELAFDHAEILKLWKKKRSLEA